MTADPLPRTLRQRSFTVAEAEAQGVSPSRLRAKDLTSPSSGTRAGTSPTTPLELARAYAPKMGDGEFFSHLTAALLHGMWLPLRLELALEVHVSVRKPVRAPRDRRVKGHHLIDRPGLEWRVDGLAVSNPWETWAQLAWLLTEDQLVVAGESLLAKGRTGVRAMHAHLLDVASDPDRHFHAKLAKAAARLRIGSRSAAESRFRLFLVRSGLEEPEINIRLFDREGRFIAEGDLVYRRERVLVEYQGDYHREKKQFRKDITRVEKLQDNEWHVIQVTEDDVKEDPAGTVARIRRALERRRPAP